MATPADLRKQFIKAFETLARHRDKHDVLADFLEMAVCAIRKRTVPPGSAADMLEEQYMAVVRRNKPEDVRAMPELLAITTLAVQEGGCDFLGQIVGDLGMATGHMGQFFTPYDLSRMMAELTLDSVDEIIAGQGFVTVQEPACGAGGMIIAVADVLARKGYDIGQCLYVEAVDMSPLCFRMSYLQASLRGIPATIRHGNTLSLEMFDRAVTPAFIGFYAIHKDGFDAWRLGEGRGAVSYDAELTQRDVRAEEPDEPAPEPPPATQRQVTRPQAQPRQLSLFDPDEP